MVKENDRNEYAKKRKGMVCKLISDSKVIAQKVFLRRHNIEYTNRSGELYITQADYNKLVTEGKIAL